ncbi:PEP/pyruvate-binding domain-containing protein [Myxococcota bacterium]|nr:PEP/pyruvate-binding domain-containing protein [Myxococcota bacterium]
MTLALLLLLSCRPQPAPVAHPDGACLLDPAAPPAGAPALGCDVDFDALASTPLSSAIPGARSVKTVLDRADGDAQWFQDTVRYPLHWDFAVDQLSGDGLPLVPDQASFSATEYHSPDRRFLLGALTHYEQPDAWVFELAAWDAATVDLVEQAFRAVAAATWVADRLAFHPTSAAQEALAETLPEDIPVVTTADLFEGIDYQPLNTGSSMGLLTFHAAQGLDSAAVGYREIVVLDHAPQDIGVVAGIVTAEFQTPLSHLNVLSVGRGTPNMALRDAWSNAELRAMEGRWVELVVEADTWSVREVTQAEAEAWWAEHQPEPLVITPMDTSVQDLLPEEEILDLDGQDLGAALSAAIPVVGGKAAHYGGLAHIGDAVPHPEAFAVPMYWYDRHMTQHGLWGMVDELLADPDVAADAALRSARLEALRDAIEQALVDPTLVALVEARIREGYQEGRYPQTRFRFRSSTNAEDLSGFNGAGLYDSESADPEDTDDPVDRTIAAVWASAWGFRAFEERSYYGIDHRDVGMALLCHISFPEEDSNGVAVTANVFDESGLEPAFYVNVQVGEESVVSPRPGVTAEQLLYYYGQPGQPVAYLAHSSLLEDGQTVLDAGQLLDLGAGLQAVHDYFAPVYDEGGAPYAMDVEFKFDTPDGATDPELVIKQARPYVGWTAGG